MRRLALGGIPVDSGSRPDDTTLVRQHRAAGLALHGVRLLVGIQPSAEAGKTREGYYS